MAYWHSSNWNCNIWPQPAKAKDSNKLCCSFLHLLFSQLRYRHTDATDSSTFSLAPILPMSDVRISLTLIMMFSGCTWTEAAWFIFAWFCDKEYYWRPLPSAIYKEHCQSLRSGFWAGNIQLICYSVLKFDVDQQCIQSEHDDHFSNMKISLVTGMTITQYQQLVSREEKACWQCRLVTFKLIWLFEVTVWYCYNLN